MKVKDLLKAVKTGKLSDNIKTETYGCHECSRYSEDKYGKWCEIKYNHWRNLEFIDRCRRKRK